MKENEMPFPEGKSKDGLPKQPEAFKCLGHKDRISSLEFHPIHDRLASASEDASIKYWDSESGDVEKTFKGHMGKVSQIAFN